MFSVNTNCQFSHVYEEKVTLIHKVVIMNKYLTSVSCSGCSQINLSIPFIVHKELLLSLCSSKLDSHFNFLNVLMDSQQDENPK